MNTSTQFMPLLWVLYSWGF